MAFRIYSDIIIFLVAVLIPGWSFFVLGALASYFFVNFYEFLLISFLVDSIYGFAIPGLYGFRFVFTFFSLMVFVITRIFKKRVRLF